MELVAICTHKKLTVAFKWKRGEEGVWAKNNSGIQELNTQGLPDRSPLENEFPQANMAWMDSVCVCVWLSLKCTYFGIYLSVSIIHLNLYVLNIYVIINLFPDLWITVHASSFLKHVIFLMVVMAISQLTPSITPNTGLLSCTYDTVSHLVHIGNNSEF